MNVYGCVALAENDTTTSSCAAKVSQSDQCASIACVACTDEASFVACQEASAQGACKTYVAASAACVSKLPASANECLPSQTDTQETWARRVSAKFCGPR